MVLNWRLEIGGLKDRPTKSAAGDVKGGWTSAALEQPRDGARTPI